jgi:hypothetical protein
MLAHLPLCANSALAGLLASPNCAALACPATSIFYRESSVITFLPIPCIITADCYQFVTCSLLSRPDSSGSSREESPRSSFAGFSNPRILRAWFFSLAATLLLTLAAGL